MFLKVYFLGHLQDDEAGIERFTSMTPQWFTRPHPLP
jgi:hypothetical protein